VRPTGKLKTVECLAFIESLEARGLLRLPQRRPQRRRSEGATVPVAPRDERVAPLEGLLKDFQPLDAKKRFRTV
jgi:hypothetical protein